MSDPKVRGSRNASCSRSERLLISVRDNPGGQAVPPKCRRDGWVVDLLPLLRSPPEMCSEPTRVGSLQANLVKYLALYRERVSSLRLLAFHATVFFWHLWLNYGTFRAVWPIFLTRQDLVDKNCGFGIQYITIWNQIVVQVYFSACLLQDILEVFLPRRDGPVKSSLRRVIPYWFASFAFPLSFMVAINFWGFYGLKRDIVDEDNIMETYIPEWINHGLHTIIVLLVCIEKFLVHRSYPNKAQAFLGVCSIVIAYAATCTFLYAISGLWPYPLVRDMSLPGKFAFVAYNCTLGVVLVTVGDAINKKIWGEARATSGSLTEKKVL